MGIEITKWRKFEKNSLQGFCNILMTNIGLEIQDGTVHEKDGKKWVGLPAKPYQDDEGNTKYSYIVKFVDKEKYQQFQKAALKALDDLRTKKDIKDIPEDDTLF
jgi:hypothetical protein